MWRDWQPGHSGDIHGRYLVRNAVSVLHVARVDALAINQSISDGLSICKICESISEKLP